MLVVDKNLNPKNVHGEKHRSPSFSISAIFSIPFLILAIVTSSNFLKEIYFNRRPAIVTSVKHIGFLLFLSKPLGPVLRL